MDELTAELERISADRSTQKRKRLQDFQKKLADLKFFDPACGCGNFLVIAYREIRTLELRVLTELYPTDERLEIGIEGLSRCNVDQFYGIEIDEFPARIAEVAMWMMDHIMNNRLALEFGQAYARIPLQVSPCIINGDALEIDWDSLLPAKDCDYLFGNPPFIGSKEQSSKQRSQVQRIAALSGAGGTLDFVTPWFIKGGEYSSNGKAQIGFVATNSITQGEQVAQLWPILFERCRLEIAFAHRTFRWGSEAAGVAHVHVVILGLVSQTTVPTSRRLFTYPDIEGDPVESRHTTISPYLIDASRLENPHLVVWSVKAPIVSVPEIRMGSKPIDDGNLIFDSLEERDEFIRREPLAGQFIRPYVGAQEYVNGKVRYILALQNASPAQKRAMPLVLERLERTKQFRLKSTDLGTRRLADTPEQFHITVIPISEFLIIPLHTSETRDYIPIGFARPPVVPSNATMAVLDCSVSHFALMTSQIHMAWMRVIGGRIKSDFRYSAGIVYNNFPWPTTSEADQAKLASLGQAVLDARARYPDSTLADLYDPRTMPTELRKAHQAIDQAVDKLYRPQPFTSDLERVEHLLALYEQLRNPLFASGQVRRGSRRRPST